MAMSGTGGAPPQTLTDDERKLYDAMKKLGCVAPDKLRSADDIMNAAKLPKGKMLNWLQALEKKGYAKRVARGKSAGYYLTK